MQILKNNAKSGKKDANYGMQFTSFFALEKLEKHKKITKSLDTKNDVNPFFSSSAILHIHNHTCKLPLTSRSIIRLL